MSNALKYLKYNDYFASVFTREDSSAVPVPVQKFNNQAYDCLLDIEFDSTNIARVIGKLHIDKSAGVDNLSPRLLKEIGSSISTPVAMLLRKSLDEGSIPVDWRLANVSPIFMKGK